MPDMPVLEFDTANCLPAEDNRPATGRASKA